ncbi:MAG: hypothetical protein FWC79_03955 [Oscillospiraceae bacterium]|nr:hypothetical protein [Oscillospiraceae bacterium]
MNVNDVDMLISYVRSDGAIIRPVGNRIGDRLIFGTTVAKTHQQYFLATQIATQVPTIARIADNSRGPVNFFSWSMAVHSGAIRPVIVLDQDVFINPTFVGADGTIGNKVWELEVGQPGDKWQDADTNIYHTTDDNTAVGVATGTLIVNGESIEVRADEELTYRVVNTRRPDGYSNTIIPFYVRITTGMEWGEVVVKEAELGIMEAGVFVPQNIDHVCIHLMGNEVTIIVEFTPSSGGNPEGSFDLYIRKIDEQGNLITDNSAEFEITKLIWDNSHLNLIEILIETHETTQAGTIRLEDIEITSDGEFILRIQETVAPEGYMKIEDAFYLRVTAIQDGDIFAIILVELGRMEDEIFIPENILGIEISREDNVITINVVNKKESIEGNFDLYIRKTNEQGNLITDNSAEFEITRLVWDNSDFVEVDMGLHETTLAGTIRLEDMEITYDGEVFIFRVEEVEAPDGYERIVDPFYIKVETKQEGNEFVIVEPNGITVGRIENGNFIAMAIAGVTATREVDITKEWVAEECICVGQGLCNPGMIEVEVITEVVQIDVANKLEQQGSLLVFNLALRTFIGHVETNGVVTNLNRAPIVSMPDDFEGELIYTFPINKSANPVQMTAGSIIIQTIRVFNEGTIAGYVNEIVNDIPAGLEFLPSHSTNLNYEWIMIDSSGQVTTDASEAVEIRTRHLEDNRIEAFDPDLGVELGNPDYRDIQVAFKVTDEGGTGRIIVSRSEIYDAEAYGDGTVGYINLLEEELDTEYMYVVRSGNGNGYENGNNNNNEDDGEVKGEYRPEEENNNQGAGNAVSTADDTNMFRYKMLVSIAISGLLLVLVLKEKRS